MLCATALVLVLTAAEYAGRTAWRKKGGPARLALFAERVRTTASYRFYDPPGLVLPLPGVEVVLRGVSRVDRFRTKDALGKGFGLFDDGLDERPVRAVALGDSLTQGAGSLDNLSQGWVALVEKASPGLDFVNLADAGPGTLQQVRFCRRLAPLVRHQVVVLSFRPGDLLDNADPFDWNKVLKELPAGEDPNQVFLGIREALDFELPERFLLGSPVKSRAVWAGLCLARRWFGAAVLPPGVREARIRYDQMVRTAADPSISEEIRAIGQANRASARTVPRAEGRKVAVRVFPYQSDPKQIAALARHSAGIVNAFHRELRAQGKRLLLVIHPSMGDVYLSRKDWALLGADADRPMSLFKRALAKDLPVLDLTERMRKASGESPEALFWFDDDLYSPVGHAVAAEGVAAFLAERIPIRRP